MILKPSGPLQPRLRTASSSAEWTRPCGKSPATPCPPKIHISQQDGDYYNVMPCIYERGNLAMVKMIGRHGHENRIMDLFRQDPDVHFVLCDTYEEVIAIHDLVFAANLLARAETPDTPYRCCRKKYFIRCF